MTSLSGGTVRKEERRERWARTDVALAEEDIPTAGGGNGPRPV